jgi:hypothetical protein
LAYIGHAAMFKPKRGVAGSHELDWRHRTESQASLVGLDSVEHADAEVNLAAFHHGQRVAGNRLDQFHLHTGVAKGILGQECRKNGFDLHR